MIEPYDSTQDTKDHIEKVQGRLREIRTDLYLRGEVHDLSKLDLPEKAIFDEVSPKLKALTYGSDEYKAALMEMGEALTHHYEVNSHHPEHWPNGINGMTLMEVVEMFADWKAASERHADGNFAKSLEINRTRFKISDQLAAILENTRRELKW